MVYVHVADLPRLSFTVTVTLELPEVVKNPVVAVSVLYVTPFAVMA
jgi:hypothetical protein